jgi:hypothetical protein
MGWQWWLAVGWVVSGLIALAMEFRDSPAMRENIGWAEVWRVVLGPGWLLAKLWQWIVVREAR